jgi:hypothetical protein
MNSAFRVFFPFDCRLNRSALLENISLVTHYTLFHVHTTTNLMAIDFFIHFDALCIAFLFFAITLIGTILNVTVLITLAFTHFVSRTLVAFLGIYMVIYLVLVCKLHMGDCLTKEG